MDIFGQQSARWVLVDVSEAFEVFEVQKGERGLNLAYKLSDLDLEAVKSPRLDSPLQVPDPP